MNEFFDFLIKNWQLSSLFLILLVIYMFLEIREKVGGAQKVDPTQLTTMINRDKAVVLDIREKEHFSEGHIVGAITCPSAEIDDKLKKLKKHMKQPIVVVDATGQHTAVVVQKLLKSGFEKVFSLKGGISAWTQAELPLKKG